MENELESVLNDVDSLQLLGYAGVEKQEMLLGALLKMPAAKRSAVLKRITSMSSAGGANLTPRDQAILRIDGLPEDIQKALADKRYQLVEDTLYVVKAAGTVNTIRMFQPGDVRGIGVGNVANQMLPQDAHFLVTSVRVTSGVNASAVAATFGVIPAVAANGEFDFKINNGQYVLPQDNALSRFDTTNQTTNLVGESKLSNPKWIRPLTNIEFNMNFPAATVANTNFKVELIGARVSKV